MKPILFNTDMVRAILDNRKTMTRRVVKPQPDTDANGSPVFQFKGYSKDFVRVPVSGFHGSLMCIPPYHPGDILYVRETWNRLLGDWIYKADQKPGMKNPGKWNPSIHMPRGAARIFLRVTDIRVERLQDITDDGIVRDFDFCAEALKIMDTQQKDVACMALWDSTIKPADRAIYGWNANPWVWVIEFEQYEEPREE